MILSLAWAVALCPQTRSRGTRLMASIACSVIVISVPRSDLVGQLSQADLADVRLRYPQRHLVVLEVYDEQFDLLAGDLLILDRHNLSDAVLWVDNVFSDRELRHGLRHLRRVRLRGRWPGRRRWRIRLSGAALDADAGGMMPDRRLRVRR